MPARGPSGHTRQRRVPLRAKPCPCAVHVAVSGTSLSLALTSSSSVTPFHQINPLRLSRPPPVRQLFSVRAPEHFRLDTPSTSRRSLRMRYGPRQNQNRCPRGSSAAAAVLASTIPCARFPRRSNGRRHEP